MSIHTLGYKHNKHTFPDRQQTTDIHIIISNRLFAEIGSNVLRDLAHNNFMELFDKVLLKIAKSQLDDYCPHRYRENM